MDKVPGAVAAVETEEPAADTLEAAAAAAAEEAPSG